MNTVVSNQPHATQDFSASDVYDPDDVGGSPVMKPVIPKLIPSPSPEPLAPPKKIRSGKGPRNNVMRSNMGESVLLHHMANGNTELSREVATVSIVTEDKDKSARRASDPVSSDDDSSSVTSDEEVIDDLDHGDPAHIKNEKVEFKIAPQSKDDKDYLTALAAQAVLATKEEQTPEKTDILEHCRKDASTIHASSGEPMEDIKPSLPSIIVDHASARPILEVTTRNDIHVNSPDALPPIQSSPVSSNSNSVTLPSISSQFRNIKLPDTPRDMGFPQSPPPPPLFNQGSPPRSPLDYRDRALPSPGNFLFHQQQRRHSQADQHTYTGSIDYSSSSNVETPE